MTNPTGKKTTTTIVTALLLMAPFVVLAVSERVSPKLAIKIPTVNFSGITANGNFLSIPWLAQYISGVHVYLIAVASFLAAVFMVIGGLQIVYAGGNASTVTSGRNKIKNALAGLVIAAASTTILYAINPKLTELNSINIETVPSTPLNLLNDRYAANSQASQTLQEAVSSMTPEEQEQAKKIIEQSQKPIDLDIPRDCPGRDYSYRPQDKVVVNGRTIATSRNYAIKLDDKAIEFWLNEQKRTGVPAGALLAQMLTETGNPGKCAAANPWNAGSCGGPAAANFNFGGVSCNNKQSGGCANVGFPVGAHYEGETKTISGLSCSDSTAGVGSTCKAKCESTGGVRNVSAVDCGPGCYPQPSGYSRTYQGKVIWFPSVQCSKKYNSLSEFLDSHMGFVRFCLPYNDSVYKFAYCIGASTYAGATGYKALVLAEIIERNCLCDPEKDSLGCKRNHELEEKLAQTLIQKRNLNLFAKECEVERKQTGSAFSIGTCAKLKAGSGIDYLGIVEALKSSTGGLLDVAPPQDDIGMTVLSEE